MELNIHKMGNQY